MGSESEENIMSIIKCRTCGGTTNTTTCNLDKTMQTDTCYVKWVNDKPVKGCGYDDFKAKVLKSKDKYGMFELVFCSDILKKG